MIPNEFAALLALGKEESCGGFGGRKFNLASGRAFEYGRYGKFLREASWRASCDSSTSSRVSHSGIHTNTRLASRLGPFQCLPFGDCTQIVERQLAVEQRPHGAAKRASRPTIIIDEL